MQHNRRLGRSGQALEELHQIASLIGLKGAERFGLGLPNTAALDHVVHNFQNAIAIDTLRNNFLFRRQILSWLLAAPTSMDALNTRGYFTFSSTLPCDGISAVKSFDFAKSFRSQRSRTGGADLKPRLLHFNSTAAL